MEYRPSVVGCYGSLVVFSDLGRLVMITLSIDFVSDSNALLVCIFVFKL